jgi:hypothetical protein
MKKFILLTCLLSFAAFSSYSQTTLDSANAIAGALELAYLDVNSLSEQSYCLLVNIVNDTVMTDEEKLEAISEEPSLDYFWSVLEIQIGTLLDYDAYNFTQDGLKFTMVADKFKDDLGEPDGDPLVPMNCNGWVNGWNGCTDTYILNALASVVMCVGNPGCIAAAYLLITNSYVSCINANDAAYPGCRQQVGGMMPPNPWLGNPDQYIGEECDY